MTELVNLTQFEFTEEDIKDLIGFLYSDREKNKELILKLVKFGNCIKRNYNE